MIKSICLLTDPGCLLYYDGKKFEALGSSPIVGAITNNSKNEDGFFYKLMQEAKDDFDPVEYWYGSSMNFADEDPPQPYSDELLELLKEELAMLEKEKS